MEYPRNHRKIVEELMNGKFILPIEQHYEILKDNEEFYTEFFKSSFNYDIKYTQDYVYLVSDESAEMLSRDMCVFFALLSYELDRDGKNFLERIQYTEFEMDEIENYFANSSYSDLIQSNKPQNYTEKLYIENTAGARIRGLNRFNAFVKIGILIF